MRSAALLASIFAVFLLIAWALISMWRVENAKYDPAKFEPCQDGYVGMWQGEQRVCFKAYYPKHRSEQ